MLSIVVLVLLIDQFQPVYQLETVQTALSSTVELPCSNANLNIDSRNSAKIVWIRDDQADIVSLDSVITIRDPRLSIISSDNNNHQERILRLANIEEHDHGLYRCVQGDITLNEILLDVLIPPRIISHTPEHMHLTVREGRDAEFSCVATGHPPPLIIWHVNGLSRPGVVTTVEGKNESILILRNVSRFDSGRVDCSATNTLSTVNRQFLLDVKYKPMVTVPFHLSYFRLYDSATITCQACSIPAPTIFDVFRPKKAVPIKKGVKEKFEEFLNQTCRQVTVTIYLTHTSLFGPYVCRARNSVGVSHVEFVLKESTKHIKPVAEHQPSGISMNSSTSPTFVTANENEEPKRNILSTIFTTQSVARTNPSSKLSSSVFVFIFLLVLMI